MYRELKASLRTESTRMNGDVKKHHVKGDHKPRQSPVGKPGYKQPHLDRDHAPKESQLGRDISSKESHMVWDGALKEPHVFRVFYSSPFNGMEGEREELTRRYWPQLASLCSSAGIRFVPIDMRWGITTDQSNTHQTINICLREIDRSDLFVGFFGQRYGWRGLDDATLQQTFDAAVPRYPWLEKFRDRSVTELEFLHGHLNHPGQLPSIICFRDKTYDDMKRAEGVRVDDKREIYKYSIESDEAADCMIDLIKRVKSTEAMCVALKIGYSNPEEGARFMFENTKSYIENVVLKQTSVQQTLRAREVAQHSAFLSSRTLAYHGGEEYFSYLNTYVSKVSDTKPALVVGNSGSGKSALLACWVEKWQKNNKNDICVYHFVESTQQSAEPKNILIRMISNLMYELNRRDDTVEETDDDYKHLYEMSDVRLVNEWHKLLTTAADKCIKVIVVIDEISKIIYRDKIARPLFWLPTSLPAGVHIILSTDSSDTTTQEVLVQERGAHVLQVKPLHSEAIQSFCRSALQQRGKTLSDDQLSKIIKEKNASNPLFLKLLLEELCAFGKFRELDKKMDSFISAADIKSLFSMYLERLEGDYNPSNNPNVVESVMSHLYVSNHGLKESDIMEICSIESHIWSPLYYALEPFLSKMVGGFLRLSQVDLKSAIFDRYIQSQTEEKTILHAQMLFLQKAYDQTIKEDNIVPDYLCTELPKLCYAAEDKDTLVKLLLDVSMILKLNKLQKYELLEYINFLDLSDEELIEKFDNAVNQHMAEMYSKQIEDMINPNTTQQLIVILDNLSLFFSTARKSKVDEYFLERIKNICDSSPTLPEKFRSQTRNLMVYRLACLYVNNRIYDKALPLHTEVLEYYKNKKDKDEEDLYQLARSYHGLGTVHIGLKNLDEAEECFEQAISIHSQLKRTDQINILASRSSIAHVYLEKTQYEQARDAYEKVIAEEEELYKEWMPSEMSYSMTNLGICYRRLEQYDKAEIVYKKALKIKERALGRNHFDVAYAYFNLSNLARDQKQYDEALTNMKEALAIFEASGHGDSVDTMYARENTALIYMWMQRLDDGLPLFWSVYNYVTERNQLDLCLPLAFDNYLIHLLRVEDHAGVRKVARSMIACEKMQSFLPYLFLHYVDRKHPNESDTALTDEESIERAIQLYPTEKGLIFQKIDLDCLPNHDIAKINQLLDIYENAVTEFDISLIIQVGDLMEQNDWIDGAIEMYEHFHTQQPNNEAILRNLAVFYYNTKQESKSLECFKKATAVNPTDPVLKEKVAYLCLLTGDVELCRETIQELENGWGDNDQLMKQVQLYKDELTKLEQT